MLEITENMVVADLERVLPTLTRLAEHGIALSLDDFGTGYSSLEYLKLLPVSELKIDRGFVIGMRSDPRDAAIVRSAVHLGRSLGLRVVAEGVESRQHHDELTALGCDHAQGFHYSHPIGDAQLLSWAADYDEVAAEESVAADHGDRIRRLSGSPPLPRAAASAEAEDHVAEGDRRRVDRIDVRRVAGVDEELVRRRGARDAVGEPDRPVRARREHDQVVGDVGVREVGRRAGRRPRPGSRRRAAAEKSTISVPEKRPTSRASSPPSMISPPSIDWSAISDAPTPLLRISVCPTALSATSSVPTELAARSAAVRLLSPTLPVSTLPGAIARVVTALSASLPATIEPSGVAVRARTARLDRSRGAIERSLTCLEATAPFLMSLPSISRAACAGPPSATNSATIAITEVGDGRRISKP